MKKSYKTVDLSEIKPYENNPRFNDMAVDDVAESIQQCGYIAPIVCDENMVILAGHTRYKALKKLKRESVDVIIVSGLDESQKKKYRLLDNKTGELAEWDVELLEKELNGLDFGELDIDWDFEEKPIIRPEARTDIDTAECEEPEENVNVKRGDLFLLGNHRLMCGDSTNSDDVKILMGGGRADLCFTSPPYNIMSKFHQKKGIRISYLKDRGPYESYGDDLSDEEYGEFLTMALKNALSFSDDVLFNIGLPIGALKGTALFIGKNSDTFSGCIAWKKNNAFAPLFETQHGCLKNVFEPIYYFNKRNTRKFLHPKWDRAHPVGNYFESINASRNTETANTATFPIELPAYFAEWFSENSVLDLFGGTGTTLMACEQIGRKCFMMEIDPAYINIIINRWEKFTGKKAVKEGENAG